MVKRSKGRNDGIYYLDDGGTAKSNDRRNRRRRRYIIEIIKYPIGIGILLVFLLRGNAVKESINKQRVKANIAINSMVKNRIHAGNQMMDDDNANAVRDEIHADKYRWTRDSILPPVTGRKEWVQKFVQKAGQKEHPQRGDFKVAYGGGKKHFKWERDAKTLKDRPPHVDFTKHMYTYPEIMPEPPRGGAYPPMKTLGKLLKKWPQNEFEKPPSPIVERLQHFDFTDLEQLDMAKRYRDLEFPFKLTNVPELIAANAKWTDDYLTFHFDRNRKVKGAGGWLRGGGDDTIAKGLEHKYGHIPPSDGHCQESTDSFFAFFTPRNWNVKTMGETPTKDTDFTYAKWAKHARYADSVGLESTEPHYYWQSGALPHERYGGEEQKTMISVDLPSFSDPNPNFISFNPAESKGIQCRFGERGVTAATHYDGGRNMIGMISGAKRYILAPPLECPKLGIVTEKKHPTFRHSLLNFDHINILDSEESKTMPQSEREWLELSRNSMAIDTVLKAGEMLYIPSHWFHYIVSLQKSAQCNVRSGREFKGSPEWGTSEDVLKCAGDEE